ncbi:MAG: AI-2E family transporter [Eudoraea sp.]|uniref:AI-2E family transporter n=1 Tax=Eudoraea sp. TaxID=1979955 RepID=UPI003C71D870
MEAIKSTNKTSVLVHIAAFVIVVAGIMYANTLVTSLLMALFISIIVSQPILWLQKKKVPQGVSILLVFLLTVGFMLVFGGIIANSFTSFSENTPVYEENLNELSKNASIFLQNLGIDASLDNLNHIANPTKIMSFTAEALGEFGSLMGNSLTIFFLTLFLLLELDSISIKVKAIFNGPADSLMYLIGIVHSIRHYLSIKTATSLLTGVIIWIALSILGLDYAIIWAIIAFLLNYIPNIGSIIAAVPAVLFSLIQLGVGGLLWTALIFVVANMIIGNVVEPKMMGKGLGLSTFIVFLSLLFWGFMLGTVGMFLSVPLTMTIKIIMEQRDSTKWFAIVLGTQEEAQAIIENDTLEAN